MLVCHGCGRLNPDVAAACGKCEAPLRSEPKPMARDLALPGGAALPPSVPRGIPAPRETAASRFAAETRPAGLDVVGFDEEAWAAVIGPKNRDFYLPRFEALHAAGGGLRLGWHWPAFFITWYWLLYRRMWGWAIGYFFSGYLFLVLAAGALSLGLAPFALLTAAYLTLPGLFATSLYYRRCARLLKEETAHTVSRDRVLGRLEGRGGTGRAGVLIAVVLGAFFLIGLLAAVALPAYQDYTHRARMEHVMTVFKVVGLEAGATFQETGAWPSRLPAVGGGPDGVVESAIIDSRTGVIDLRLRFSPSGPAGTVSLVPRRDGTGPITWHCTASPGLQKVARQHCNGATP